MDSSQGSIRTPIETDLDFQRAFSASFGTLPMRNRSFRISLGCDRITVSIFVTTSDEHDQIDEPPKPESA